MLAVPKIDYKKTVKEVSYFIRGVVEDANASGVVIGLSGGVDSSLTAALCVQALGRSKVLGIMMPTNFTPQEDMEDARKLAKQLEIETIIINISNICGSLFTALKANQLDAGQKTSRGNIRARVRMIILYYYSNTRNYLVAGTSDRSEALIGYFTKYGDGGADFYPTIHLYKTQVRELAKYIGVPERISYKPSSPQLYPKHKAIDEIPVDYDKLDPILVSLFDRRIFPKEISQLASIPIKTVEEILHRYNKSKHKRTFPSMVKGWELD